MKRCSKCGITKPRSEFHKNAKKKDGLKCHCKECRRLSRKKLYDYNKSKLDYYVYTHSVYGEVVYIGSGCSSRAWDRHKRNSTWEEIYQEHGMPEVNIVESGLDKREALDKEQELQKKLTPKANFRYGAGKGEIRGKSAGRARAVINCRGEIFDTIADAVRKYGGSTSSIGAVCKGDASYSKRYPDNGEPIHWRYYEEES